MPLGKKTTHWACVTLAFDLPKWNLQMAQQLIQEKNWAKLIWNPSKIMELWSRQIQMDRCPNQCTDEPIDIEVPLWHLCLAQCNQAWQNMGITLSKNTLINTCLWQWAMLELNPFPNDNFSFSHSVFNRLVLQTHEKQGLFGKRLK